MGLRDSFIKNRAKWISQWFEGFIRKYPFESSPFFKNTSDPFANPIGSIVKKGLHALFDLLTADNPGPDELRKILEPIIRVQAVQDFPPSAALSFLPEFRQIVKTGLKDRHDSSANKAEFLECLAYNIDTAMLIAFDLYIECTKKLYELRATQFRNSVRQLLIKKDLMSELPEIGPELR